MHGEMNKMSLKEKKIKLESRVFFDIFTMAFAILLSQLGENLIFS